MKRLFLAGAFAAATTCAAYAAGAQLTQAECNTVWKQANPAGASSITEAEAQPYVSDFKAADPDSDSSIDKMEFSAACKSGLVTAMAHMNTPKSRSE